MLAYVMKTSDWIQNQEYLPQTPRKLVYLNIFKYKYHPTHIYGLNLPILPREIENFQTTIDMNKTTLSVPR